MTKPLAINSTLQTRRAANREYARLFGTKAVAK